MHARLVLNAGYLLLLPCWWVGWERLYPAGCAHSPHLQSRLHIQLLAVSPRVTAPAE